jgi:hypothetical protein
MSYVTFQWNIEIQLNSKIFYCLNSKYTFKQRDWTKGKAYINPFPHKMDRMIINNILYIVQLAGVVCSESGEVILPQQDLKNSIYIS